jgi:alanine dehydrogenase
MKVKEPSPEEYELFGEGQELFYVFAPGGRQTAH